MYLQGLKGHSGLGELSPSASGNINANKDIISRVLADAHYFNGLGDIAKTKKKTMSFADVVARYNKGITVDEIRAWVWYKRTLGVPMTGWEKYFIKGGTPVESVVTTNATTIKDNPTK